MRIGLIGLGLICTIQLLPCIEGVEAPYHYDELVGNRFSVLDIFQPEDIDRQRPMIVELASSYQEAWWTTTVGFSDSTVSVTSTERYREKLNSIDSRIGFQQNEIAYLQERWDHKPEWNEVNAHLAFDWPAGSTAIDAGYTGADERFFRGQFDHLVPIGRYAVRTYFEGMNTDDHPAIGGLALVYSNDALRFTGGTRYDSDEEFSPWLGFLWHFGNRFLISGGYMKTLQAYPYRKLFEALPLQWRTNEMPDDTAQAIMFERVELNLEYRLGRTRHRLKWQFDHAESQYGVDWQSDAFTIVLAERSLDHHRIEYSFGWSQLDMMYRWMDEERFEFEPAHSLRSSWDQLVVPFVHLGVFAGWQNDIVVQEESFDRWEYGASVSYLGVRDWIFSIEGVLHSDDLPDREFEDPYRISVNIAYRQGEYERLYRAD